MPSPADRYLQQVGFRDSSLSPARNYLNLQQREAAVPRLVTPEDQQVPPDEQIERLLYKAGITKAKTRDGIEFEFDVPNSTFVSPGANKPREKSYLEETVLPDAMNLALNIPMGMLEQFYKSVGMYEAAQNVPAFDVQPSGDESMSPVSVQQRERDPFAEAEGVLQLGEAVVEDPSTAIDFIKEQPVTAAAIGYGLYRGSVEGVGRIGTFLSNRRTFKSLSSVLPKDASRFLAKDAQRVLDGESAFADVFIPKSEAKNLAPQIRNIRKLAKAQGKTVRMVRTDDIDNPGSHVAIFDEAKMDDILARRGVSQKAKNYIPSVIDDPQARSTEHVRQVFKEGYGDGWTDVGRVADLNFGDYMKSPHLVLQRLHPAGPELFRSVQGAVMESRATAAAMKSFRDEFYKPIKRKYGKSKLTETMIDLERQAAEARKAGRDFSLDEALAPYPSDLQQAVKAHTELMQTVRKKKIDEMIEAGVPEEVAIDWGFEGPYITRLFQGNYRIKGRPPGGGRVTDVAQFHSRTVTDGEAWSAIKNLRKQGWTDLSYDYDNSFPMEVVSRLPRKQLERLKAIIGKNTGASREEVNAMLKTMTRGGDEVTALAAKERRAKFDRFRKRTLDDEFGNGEYDFWVGAEKDYERVTDAYIDGSARYLSISKARREFNRLQDKIPSSMRKLREYNEDLLGAVEGRRWSKSEAFDGWMQKGVEAINDKLAKGGSQTRLSIKPYAMERWVARALSITANVKLGTPRAALVNLTQTAQTLYPRVGQKVFWQAWKESSTDSGKKLARDAGVIGTPTKFEGLLTRGGETPKSLLYAFSKAEEKNRTVSFLAGRRWAQTAEGRKYAREILGLKPDDPDYPNKVGIDMVTSTQFDLSAADMAAVFGRGQNPLLRLMTQFKPFQFKYIEHLAQLRKHPNPAKAYGRAALGMFTTGGVRAMTLPLAPIKMAKYYGMFEAYKEIRDRYGETTADVFASGLPGALHMDLSYSLNVDLFPSFGNTAHEKLVSYFSGPFFASVIDATRFAGYKDPDWEDAVATARRLFPQIKMGQGIKNLLENEKWLQDTRGRKLARATGPEIAGRPLDLWMESLSFMTPRRRLAYEARYDLGRRGPVEDLSVGAQNAIQELLLGTEGTDPDRLSKEFERFAKERE